MRMCICKNIWKPALELIASPVNRLVLFFVLQEIVLAWKILLGLYNPIFALKVI